MRLKQIHNKITKNSQIKKLNQIRAISTWSRRTYSTSQLPAVELFFKTTAVALRTISLYATVGEGYECVPIYTLLLRPGPRYPLQGLTAQQVHGSFEVFAICFGPGDWVNMISSREAKTVGQRGVIQVIFAKVPLIVQPTKKSVRGQLLSPKQRRCSGVQIIRLIAKCC